VTTVTTVTASPGFFYTRAREEKPGSGVTPVTPVTDLLSRLPGVVSLGGQRWRSTCPVCDERLDVLLLGTEVLLGCAGGCTGRRVRSALGFGCTA